MPPRVVVLTTSDTVTHSARKTLLPLGALAFAESEGTLHELVARGARLVVLHLTLGSEALKIPGRLMRAVPDLRCPVVALTDSAEDRGKVEGLTAVGLLHDALCLKTERWTVLLQAWAMYPERAGYLSEELRLMQRCAPLSVVPILEEIALAPDSWLNVKRLSAEKGVSRTQLHRRIADTGYTPSLLLDAVRSLHAIGPHFARHQVQRARSRDWSAVRTQRRVLARTLGLSEAEILNAASKGVNELHILVADRLCRHFAHTCRTPRDFLPPPPDLRTSTV